MRKSILGYSLLRALLALVLLVASADVSAQGKSFLWRVEAGKGAVYLLGSLHMLKREDMDLKPVVDETFNKSKRLVFEIDLLDENPQKTQKLIMQKGLNLDGKPLQQKVSRETFQWATLWANELGIDIKRLMPMKPWLAGLTLTILHLQKMGYNPTIGVDRQLARRAQAANKPVLGLETTESQFDRFDRLPAHLQEMMLRYSIGEIEQINKVVDRLVKVWRDGDVAAAEQLFLAGMAQYPEIQDLLLDQRNREWLPQIEKFLQESDDTLVVVGAAHLLGKTGVVELLRDRGYKVEQM